MPRVLSTLVVLLLVACAERAPDPRLGSGEHHLPVPGGTIWYKVTNDSGGRGLPVVLLHGGPGFNSYYMKPLEALANERPVIRYDQLGSGKSDTISDTTMFNVQHFVAELDSLRSALGVERWHVYAHSWGTILATEYYRAHGEHVASLTMAGDVIDMPAYEHYIRALLPSLSDSAQRAIRTAERTGGFEAPAYQNAFMEFIGKYTTLHPIMADMDSTLSSLNQGIYVYMNGPSDFTVTGTLKTYDAKAFLPSIRVPALFTVGELDEVGPEVVRAHAALVPGARFELIPGAAHLTMWDNPEVNIRVVREFLRTADASSASR